MTLEISAKILPKIISFSFLILGLFLLLQTIWPQVSFKIQETALKKNSVALTSPQTQISELISVQQTEDNFPLIVSNNKRDTAAPYSYFSLTMPSIKLQDETVYVDSNDLSVGLIHLPGASLPGEKGNVFISGHSALPIFSKSQKALFANLPNAKIGDQITISTLGTKFNYQVVDIKIVAPTDVSVINPPDGTGRYISLMTCVPPGFNTKRLVVIGKLI
ncbi:MAG: class E sortase [Candidatus Daviesbacteria bacterium]|nr:class E sortase [Candidatus Daviesbacteria bacterium]